MMKVIFTVLAGFLLPLTNLLAEAAAPSAVATARDGLSPFIPLIMIFGVFYFLILRPQQKKQKDQQAFITSLKRGDMVVTSSGIIGTIRTVSDKFVTLEIDEGVSLKLLKTQVLENAANLKEERVSATKEATT
jgi:preprotein translocase subunit YajC